MRVDLIHPPRPTNTGVLPCHNHQSSLALVLDLILTPSSLERSSVDIFLVKHAPSAHDRPGLAMPQQMIPRLA
jgi:hypothetical protein